MTIDGLSMWDSPAEEITLDRTLHTKALAEAAVEPLWPYLSKAATLEEFDHRLALSGPSIERLIREAGIDLVASEDVDPESITVYAYEHLSRQFGQHMRQLMARIEADRTAQILATSQIGSTRKTAGDTAQVMAYPPCDVCKMEGKNTEAHYDGKTVFGPWANMCEDHFEQVGVGLGTGKGQKLELAPSSKTSAKDDTGGTWAMVAPGSTTPLWGMTFASKEEAQAHLDKVKDRTDAMVPKNISTYEVAEVGKTSAKTALDIGDEDFRYQRGYGDALAGRSYDDTHEPDDQYGRGWDDGMIERQQSEPVSVGIGTPFPAVAAKTAAGPISWSGDTHFGVGYLKGRAANGDNYEVYSNPNSNPTPCSWVNYGPDLDGDTAPLNGTPKGVGRGFATMAEAVADAEAHAAGAKTSTRHTAETNPPYYIEQQGGKWVVVNTEGHVKGTFDSKDEARQQQKALYANVPGAQQAAEDKHGQPKPKVTSNLNDPDFQAGIERIKQSTDPQALRDMIAQNNRLRGQMGGRGEYSDNLAQLDAQDKAAMARLKELGEDKPRTAVQALLEAEGISYGPGAIYDGYRDINDAIQAALDSVATDQKVVAPEYRSGYDVLALTNPDGSTVYQTYSDQPQAPGGMMAPSQRPPGKVVVHVDKNGEVTHTGSRIAGVEQLVYKAPSHDQDFSVEGPDAATLNGLIGKYVRVVFYNDHGVATDFDSGRFVALPSGEVEWSSDANDYTYPVEPDNIYSITRLEEPGPVGQPQLFAAKTAYTPDTEYLLCPYDDGVLKGDQHNVTCQTCGKDYDPQSLLADESTEPESAADPGGPLAGAVLRFDSDGTARAVFTASAHEAVNVKCANCGKVVNRSQAYVRGGLVPNDKGNPDWGQKAYCATCADSLGLTKKASVEALLAEASDEDVIEAESMLAAAEAAFFHHPRSDNQPAHPNEQELDIQRERDAEQASRQRSDDYYRLHPNEQRPEVTQGDDTYGNSGRPKRQPLPPMGVGTTVRASRHEAVVPDHSGRFPNGVPYQCPDCGYYRNAKECTHCEDRSHKPFRGPTPLDYVMHGLFPSGAAASRHEAADKDFSDRMYQWGYETGQKVKNGLMDPLGGAEQDWKNADGSSIDWQNSDASFPRGYRDGLEGKQSTKQAVNEQAVGTERYQNMPPTPRPDWITDWDDEDTLATREMTEQGMNAYVRTDNPLADTLTTVRQAALKIAEGEQPTTTRPRQVPKADQPNLVTVDTQIIPPPDPPPLDFGDGAGIDPTVEMGSGDFGGESVAPPEDPLVPTVDQMVAARVAALARHIVADNPEMDRDEARVLAARTVATYPQMVSVTR